MARKPSKTALRKQANEVLARAKAKGVSTNFFFITTFQRYETQLEIMEKLEDGIKAEGTLVTKEYVKGRKNIVINPAITEYNKTSTAANGTVATLVKIVDSFGAEDKEQAGDEFLEFLGMGKK